MAALRFAASLLIVLALATGLASAEAGAKASAPVGLRAFLFRVDEAAKTSFARTPSFAWKPFPGAVRYEFQLSTSSAFRENGILWRCPSPTCPAPVTPVAAPTVSLPWVTGSPHGLYARVRGVLADRSKTEWSEPLGFDVEPPAPPEPLASKPGLLRWTPVPGANGYQVWLVDARKLETVYSNVLDERELYTFHQSAAWIGTVRWRVRALRDDWQRSERVSGVPVTRYGAWSPTYRSTNPAPTSGPIRLGPTVSDVVTTGAARDDAHRLVPAFTWTGNEATDGTRAELFRVYAFTDRQCLNRVYTGSVVGSPAYAARPFGPLGLPYSGSDLAAARAGYLSDAPLRASEQPGRTLDGEPVVSVEAGASSTPLTTLPTLDDPPAGAPTPTTAAAPAAITLAQGTDLGAPVSLWDDDWPRAGYYWTVVPVEAQSPDAIRSTLASSSSAGSATVVLATTPGFQPGDRVQLGTGTATAILTISTVSGNLVTFTSATLGAHALGEPIVRLGGTVVYQDLELPQDVCAAGRIARFGINSEPTLIARDEPFASGLAAPARMTSAVHTASFFRSPLVAWAPALGASVYQVQWSAKASPFDPEPGPGNVAGVLTPATSYVLPLTPGTWYYRVRGFDWSLPTGAQAMGWSAVAKIVIAKPTFAVVGSGKAKTTARR